MLYCTLREGIVLPVIFVSMLILMAGFSGSFLICITNAKFSSVYPSAYAETDTCLCVHAKSTEPIHLSLADLANFVSAASINL